MIRHRFNRYTDQLSLGLSQVKINALNNAVTVLKNANKNRVPVFVAGNGGSCAIGEHLQCDWFKGLAQKTSRGLHVISLTANSSLFSALLNDFGSVQVFKSQIAFYEFTKAVCVFISSSGNSPNIIAGVQEAKRRGYTVIGLTGFNGGVLKYLADISLHIPIDNYGIVEDSHQALMHFIREELERS